MIVVISRSRKVLLTAWAKLETRGRVCKCEEGTGAISKAVSEIRTYKLEWIHEFQQHRAGQMAIL